MADHPVVIAGAGPTALVLAGDLASAGIDVVLVWRRPNQLLAGSRAGGLSAPTGLVQEDSGVTMGLGTARRGPRSRSERVSIRPDGYVAWAGAGLHDAMITWFGPAGPRPG